MADTVRLALEAMVPELQDAIRKKIFNQDEIKTIVKKRTAFENKLKSRGSNMQDFLQYIEYEYKLEQIRRKRISQFGQDYKASYCDWSITKHIHHLFNRGITKYGGHVPVSIWMSYIDMAKKLKSYSKLTGIYARALQFHARDLDLWLSAARWEFQVQANAGSGRKLLQRAIHVNHNADTTKLSLEWFRMECAYVTKLRARIVDSDADDLVMFAVPKLIFQHAVAKAKLDFMFRHECLRIAHACPDSQPLVDFIVASIDADQDLCCSARVLLHTWLIYPRPAILESTDPRYAQILNDAISCLDAYADGDQDPCAAMRAEILDLLINVLNHVGGASSVLGPYLVEQIRVHLVTYLNLVQRENQQYTVHRSQHPRLLLPSTWIQVLNVLQHKKWSPIVFPNQAEELEYLSLQACAQHPDNVDLCIERIKIHPEYFEYVTSQHAYFSAHAPALIQIYISVLKTGAVQHCIPTTFPEFKQVWKRFSAAHAGPYQEMQQYEHAKCELIERWVQATPGIDTDALVEWMLTFAPLDDDVWASVVVGKGSVRLQCCVYEKVIAANPTSMHWWIKYLQFLVTAANDPASAVRVYQRAIASVTGGDEQCIPVLMQAWDVLVAQHPVTS